MSFAVHTFETHPDGSNTAFAFHEHLGEGQEVYFLAKFPVGFDSARISAETIFGSIVDALKFDVRGEAGDRFEDALKAANGQAQKMGILRKERPDIVVSFFDFQTLYVATSGEAQSSLVRGGAISRITEEIGGADLFNNLLSGQVAVEDVVIISNKNPLESIPASQIGEILSRENFDDAVSAVRHELTTKSSVDLLVTILGIGKKSASGAAGFLSKMVSKMAPSVETEPVVSVPKSVLEEAMNESSFAKTSEDKEAEVLVPKKKPAPVVPEEQEELFAEQEEIEEPGIEDDFEEEYESREPGALAVRLAEIRQKASQMTLRQVKMAAGGVLAILILVLGIRFLTSFETQETSQLREQLGIAREALQQADTFLIQGDRSSAAELLAQAQQAAQEVLNSKSKDYRSDAQFILADVQEKQLQVENAKKVQPQLLADLATQNEGMKSLGVLDLRGNLFAYDENTVYKTVRNIVEKGVSVSEKTNIVSAAARVDQSTLLFYTDAPQIVEFANGVVTPMSTADTTWKQGIDIQAYSKYAYVLDPVENQIWKYERQRSAYTAASSYNNGADLSRAVSFAIDGAIYILSDDGTIQKLFRGEKQDYSFREIPSTPFEGQNIKIFTTDEHDYIYVLDPDNARVLVFTKGERFATYKKQVLFSLPDARDFSVDSAGQKINIVTADKIYEFSL
jgi:hypothetical protein